MTAWNVIEARLAAAKPKRPPRPRGPVPIPNLPGEWVTEAACQDTPTDWWFPKQTPNSQVDVFRHGRLVCKRCPVQTQCLAHALEHREDGFWAGTTAEDREQIRRRRR